MAGFLRRLRRPKEEAVEGEEVPSPPEPELTEEVAPEAEPEAEPEPEAEVAAPPESPAPPVQVTPPVAPAPPIPPPTTARSSPPPLPEADRNAARSSIAPRRTTTNCFLCGTEMDGPWCPKCRMAWTD